MRCEVQRRMFDAVYAALGEISQGADGHQRERERRSDQQPYGRRWDPRAPHPHATRRRQPPPRRRRAVTFRAALAALGCLFLLGSSPRGAPITSVTVIAEPGPFASVEEAAGAEKRVNWWDADPVDDDACTECFAARELVRLLPRALGIDGRRVRSASPGLLPSGDLIVLGNRRSNGLVRRLPGEPATGEPGSFRVRSFGWSGHRVVLVEGADRAGTLYGAYALLEALGVRFYEPGEVGTVVLPSDTPQWPGTSLDESPAFGVRGFWAWE